MERQKAEQEAAQKKIDDANRKIHEEKAALEKEKAVQEAAAIARNLAIKEEREAQERKAKEKEEAEKRAAEETARAEAMKPDKEKLFAFADKVMGLGAYNMKLNSKEAQTIYDDAIREIIIVANDLEKEAEAL